MSKPSPLGVIAASTLATFALAGCVALGPGPTATPTPTPTPSSADEEVGDVLALVGGEPTRQIEFLTFATEYEDEVVFSNGRVIGATDQFIVIEVACSSREVMETILGETLAAFTVALAPAGLYGF